MKKKKHFEANVFFEFLIERFYFRSAKRNSKNVTINPSLKIKKTHEFF